MRLHKCFINVARSRATTCLLIAAIGGPASAQGQTTTFNPGTRDLFVLDFAGLKKDELPKGLTAKGRAKPEVVTKDGTTMLKATELTELLVHLPENLPSAFTIQFEITPKVDGAPEDVSFEGTVDRNRGDASMDVLWQVQTLIAAGGGEYFQMPMPDAIALTLPLRPVPIDVSFDGGAFRLFTDGKLLMDLSNRQFVRGRVLRVVLGGGCNEQGKCVTPEDIDKYSVYLSKLRIAAGGGVLANNNNQGTNSPPQNIPKTIPVTVTAGRNAPVVSWPAIVGANGYAVSRRKIDDASCCNNSSGATYGATSPWTDAQLPMFGTYVYRVVASTPSGQISGEAQFVFSGTVTGVVADAPPTTGTITPMTPSTVTKGTTTDRNPQLNVATGPAPSNLSVDGIPNLVQVLWNTVDGAVRYEVSYAPAGTTNWSPPASPQPGLLGRQMVWVGSPPDLRMTYTYRVIAYQADGKMGEAKADYKTPTFEPKNFTATPIAPGQVRLEWDDIRAQWNSTVQMWGTLFGFHGDEITYFLSGPGTGTGISVAGTTKSTSERNTFTLTGVPAGPQTWNLTVSWDPGGILTPNTSWAKASATVAANPLPRYRLVALGFKAIQQSKDLDDARDGHGDEVYLTALVNRTQLTGDTLRVTGPSNVTIAMTRAHGDESVAVPYGRVKAGTATNSGGIRSGDVVPDFLDLTKPTGPLQQITFPLLLWQGQFSTPNDVVIAHVALWEGDDNPIAEAQWLAMMTQLTRSGYAVGPGWQTGPNAYGAGRTRKYIYQYTHPPYDHWDQQPPGQWGDLLNTCGPALNELSPFGLCQIDGVDRPLGATLNGSDPSRWYDHFIVLTSSIAEEVLTAPQKASAYQLPRLVATPGTFRIELHDADNTGTGVAARYELYLRLERVP